MKIVDSFSKHLHLCICFKVDYEYISESEDELYYNQEHEDSVDDLNGRVGINQSGLRRCPAEYKLKPSLRSTSS